MQLITMHKVLISTAIIGGLLFSLWSVYSWTQTGATGALLMSGISALATVGMGVYLRVFMRKNGAPESDAT